jgi:hypothetical protein
MDLTQHDSRLITAAIMHLLAITRTGQEGAEALQSLTDLKSLNMLRDATVLLGGSKEGSVLSDVVTVNQETFADNLNRLSDIARELLGKEDFQTATLEPIDPEGKTTGSKQYQLWLTHDQIHLVHWAVSIAENLVVQDVAKIIASVQEYEAVRGDIDEFVNKFNQVHEVARQSDAEG